MRRIFQVAAFLLLVTSRAPAQSNAPGAETGPTDSSALPGGHVKTNILTANISLVNFYDSNYLSNNEMQQGNFNWFILPQFAVAASRPHVDWSISYSPTVTIDPRVRANELFAHNLNAEFHYRPTRRLSFGVQESLRVETHLLDRLTEQPSTTDFGFLDQLNESVLPPADRRIYQQAGVEVDYLLDRYTTVGISGSFAQARFRDLPNQDPVTGSLIDSQIGGGRVFLSRRISRRHTIGVMYQLHSLLFQGGEARAITHSVLYTHSIAFTPRTSLSFFAGPEFSRIHNQVLVSLNLFPLIAQFTVNTLATPTSFNGGATYQWQGDRTVLLGTLVSQVSDSGGLFGTSRLQAATGTIRRQLARRWKGGLDVSYGTTSTLGITPSSSTTMLLASTSLSRALTEHVTVEFRYARLHQVGYAANSLISPGDHNLAYVSLTYQFTRPLGY